MRTRAARPACLAAAVLLTLTGCGGAGTGDEGDPTTPPATDAAAPATSSAPAAGDADGDPEPADGDGQGQRAQDGQAQGPGGERSLRARIRALPVSGETRAGYERERFDHWNDADDDCRDTRDEVLAAESRTAVSGCDVEAGRWVSYYDGRRHTQASRLHIDHLVPLAEAWDSGARRWSSGTRRRFANDLGDDRSLVAVTGAVNRSKSDDDPAEWLPSEARCRYAAEWVAVKTRWRLSVDRPERRALLDVAEGCEPRTVPVERARVEPAPPPGDDGGGSGGAGAAGSSGGYRYPPPPPDLDCGGVEAGDFEVRPGDPHRFDGDGDGIGCES